MTEASSMDTQADSTAADVVQPVGKSSKTPVVLLVFALLAATLGGYLWYQSQLKKNELEKQAREALIALQGIPMSDANQQHVVSLNLQLVKDQAKLDEALQWVGKLYQLQVLDLSNAPVTDEALAAVSNLGTLNSLHLNNTKVTDACMQHIVKLNQLQGLHLAGTQVTDNALAEIATLDNLMHLDLSNTTVGRELGQLANIKSLKWLLLREITLSDSIVEAVAKLTNLKRLTVSEGVANSAMIDRLKRQLPQLNVN